MLASGSDFDVGDLVVDGERSLSGDAPERDIADACGQPRGYLHFRASRPSTGFAHESPVSPKSRLPRSKSAGLTSARKVCPVDLEFGG